MCDPDYENTTIKWNNEHYNDDSNIDDNSKDYHKKSKHDTDSELSTVDSDENHDTTQINMFMIKKKKKLYKWSATEMRPVSRTRKHNIVMKIPAKARKLGETLYPLSGFSNKTVRTIRS